MDTQAESPTFELLNGRMGWHTGLAAGITAGRVSGLRLEAAPSGPLSLAWPDGSLGGLVLPRGLALDAALRLYLLCEHAPLVKRFDPARQQFVALPDVGGLGSDARQFRQPANIAIAGDRLCVVDTGNRNAQVFDLGSLALIYRWGPQDSDGRAVAVDNETAWRPVDVTAHAGCTYILDSRYQRVLVHRPGRDRLKTILRAPDGGATWTRIGVDRDGNLYLLDASHARLDMFDSQGHSLGGVADPGAIRDRFDPPPVRTDHRQRFVLPHSLAQPCGRHLPASELPEDWLQPAALADADALIFDLDGQRLAAPILEPPGPAVYQARGAWISQAFDSKRSGCQWHRIELELSDAPPETRLIVRTHTSDRERPIDEIAGMPDHVWDTHYSVMGAMQPPPSAGGGLGNSIDRQAQDLKHEFLVQSGKGQFLWLKIELWGDGYRAPAVASLRLHFPRQSYLAHLPRAFAEDVEAERFLERFLSIFQTDWDELERSLQTQYRQFSPEAVPAGESMARLAGWLGVRLEGAWSDAQRRRLLSEVPRIQPKRGTPAGLRRYAQLYLLNITGLEPGDICGWPAVVEGFRERQYLLLSARTFSELGGGAPLWGAEQVRRLQLDVFSRAGEVRLVSAGDPQRDVFGEFAHRFRVFIPSAWVRTAKDERMVRRALDNEKPAHTQYDLCLVEPRLRVGIQSTVGLDTIVGTHPVAVLARASVDDAGVECGECGECGAFGDPPSQPPRHVLGYDTVLSEQGDAQCKRNNLRNRL